MNSYIESEIVVLSVILNKNYYIVKALDKLKPDDFYLIKHQLIYKKMIELYKNNIKFDLTVLINKLEKEIKNNVITITELSNIDSSFTTTQTFNSNVDIILEASKNRKLKDLSNYLVTNEDSIDDKINHIQDVLIEINSNKNNDSVVSMADVVESTLKKIEESMNSKDGITGIKTNVSNLDNAINGLERGSMIVFGARPSMGKTAFSINLIKNIKAKVLFVQLDMTLEGMVQRMLSSETRINNTLIGKGKLNDEQLSKVINKASFLSVKDNIFLYAPARATVTNILLKAKEIQIKYGLDAIVIDHIGKLTPETKGSKYEQMTEISRRLKAMFRELNVAGVVLCQLSRLCESRQDKRPMLSDLRDTGAIEEDADVIGLLYRDGYYKDKEQGTDTKEDTLEVNIQKNRNGQCGLLGFEYRLNTQELIPII